MKYIRFLLCVVVCLCLLGGILPCRAAEGGASVEQFAEKYQPLLQDGIDALEELTDGRFGEIAGKLAESMKEFSPEELAADLRAVLDLTVGMSDEALAETIADTAARCSLSLTDSQTEKLVKLIRKLEKFSPEELKEKLQNLQSRSEALAEKSKAVRETLSGLRQTLDNVRVVLARFVDSVRSFFSGLRRK